MKYHLRNIHRENKIKIVNNNPFLEEQRKKEKEMREKKLLEEKLEKQREKELKEQQRKIEREEKGKCQCYISFGVLNNIKYFR